MIYHKVASFMLLPAFGLKGQSPEATYAMCLWGEARGQSLTEKAGVAHVILNRASKPYGPGGVPRWWMQDHSEDLLTRVKSVILQPWQFSCFNANDPNSSKLLEAPYRDGGSAWNECVAVCAAALDGLVSDPTNDADHYHSYGLTDYALGKWPSWAKVGRECAVLGRFRFYRLES